MKTTLTPQELQGEARLKWAEVAADYPTMKELPDPLKRCTKCKEHAAFYKGEEVSEEEKWDAICDLADEIAVEMGLDPDRSKGRLLEIARIRYEDAEESLHGAPRGEFFCLACGARKSVFAATNGTKGASDRRQIVADLALEQFEQEMTDGLAEAERLLRQEAVA